MKRPGFARVTLFTAVCLLAAGVVRPAGQQSSQQTPPARTLSSGSVPVTVDFIVLNRDGTPVMDLKPEDVTLRVDNKTRQLRSLALMTVGAGSDT